MSTLTRRALWAPFLATLAVLLIRAPDRLLDGFLWAEDVKVFMQSAYTEGWHSIFDPYSFARYMCVLPHVLTRILAATFPLPLMPYAMVWTAAMIFAVSNTYVFSVAMESAHGSRFSRWSFSLGMALSTLLVPHVGEVFLTITNVQWIIAPSAFAMIYRYFWKTGTPPPSYVEATVASAFLVIVSISGPFGLCLLPIAALGIVLRKTWKDRTRIAIAAVYTLGVLAQVHVMMGPWPKDPPLQKLPWISGFLTHIAAEPFLPATFHLSPGVSESLGAAVIALLLWVALTNRAWFICGVFGSMGIVLWVAAMARINSPETPFVWTGGGSRYTYMPILFMSWILVLGIAKARFRATKTIGIALLAMMAVSSGSEFRLGQFPRWSIEQRKGHTTVIAPPSPDWRATL